MDEQVKQWLLLGREHFQKRELDKAEAYLNQVLEKNDRLADVHDMLGLIAHARGNYDGAESHFARGPRPEPGLHRGRPEPRGHPQ
ncbi:MAG: tetratricopeptide repeat protein [Polyangiaceae bacterium]